MKLKTELKNIKQKILIIDNKLTLLSKILKREIEKYDNEIYLSPKISKNLLHFNYCFVINNINSINRISPSLFKRIVFIFINQNNQAEKYFKTVYEKKIKNIKIINLINFNDINEANIEKILWFSFIETNEILLKIEQPYLKKEKKILKLPTIYHLFNRKKIVLSIIFFLLAYHLFFIPPLLLSSYYFYQTYKSLKNDKIEQAISQNRQGSFFLNITKKTYSFSRPSYLLFSLALIPDNLIQIEEKIKSIFDQLFILYGNSNEIIRLLLKINKSQHEKTLLALKINRLDLELKSLEEDFIFLSQKLPNYPDQFKKSKKELSEILEIIIKLKKVSPYLDQIFAKGTEKKYLLFFANNMELRPGGGFIGSFGIMTIKDLTLTDLKIYDVYDADGQLIAHIEPPPALKKYLQQPHWFLRDSAFSPDFSENYLEAKMFLDKEMKLGNFSGGILITTSAIKNILTAYGNLYIPDFKEIVNKDNFYLKAQLYAEKDFFPGSAQKKIFLSSLTRQILINIDNVSVKTLMMQLKNSLDEKQLVVFLEDQNLQKLIDSFYWSGRLINPRCPENFGDCIIDYIFPIDANLGVNKANFFINRYIDIKINIDSQGNLNNHLILRYKNNSQNEIFPGGIYKNYFQIFLPKNSSIKEITKNDVLIEDYDEINGQFKKIGFYFEIKPQTTEDISIKYSLPYKLEKGKYIYQLLLQKQIGYTNNDVILKIDFPKNIYLLNQNFSALVKNNQIVYNTNLSTDKIFFIELIKE